MVVGKTGGVAVELARASLLVFEQNPDDDRGGVLMKPIVTRDLKQSPRPLGMKQIEE